MCRLRPAAIRALSAVGWGAQRWRSLVTFDRKPANMEVYRDLCAQRPAHSIARPLAAEAVPVAERRSGHVINRGGRPCEAPR
jgi:hypothetical protein